jgi:hypothetical protein
MAPQQHPQKLNRKAKNKLYCLLSCAWQQSLLPVTACTVPSRLQGMSKDKKIKIKETNHIHPVNPQST